MKTLVTHINPHLDDIAAIWLFKKFHPEFREAEIKFISAGKGNLQAENNEDTIMFGIGRGTFDEHKGDIKDCSTSLVWKEINKNGLAPKNPIEKAAYDELVEWSRLVDLGQTEEEFDAFSIPAFIRPRDNSQEGSKKAVELGVEILDRVLDVLRRKQLSLRDWQSRVEFKSRFGRSFAVKSHYVNRAFCKAQGGELFLMYDPKYSGAQYFTPVEEIDLEPIYKKVKRLDLEADWFLHQSHHMVLCGSASAPDSKPTKLSFEQLIEVAKSI